MMVTTSQLVLDQGLVDRLDRRQRHRLDHAGTVLDLRPGHVLPFRGRRDGQWALVLVGAGLVVDRAGGARRPIGAGTVLRRNDPPPSRLELHATDPLRLVVYDARELASLEQVVPEFAWVLRSGVRSFTLPAAGGLLAPRLGSWPPMP